MTDRDSTVLEAEALSLTFPGSRRQGPVLAVRNVNLVLKAGGGLAVIGESGSGKTSLMRLLLGLLPPTEGKVRLLGRDLNAVDKQERTALRRRCGYVPQDPFGGLPPTLSVLEAAAEPALLVWGRQRKEEARAKALELLTELRVDPSLLEARVSRSVSGGQRQRVAVARGMVLGPELLLADEPTSMQDASTRDEVISVLDRHRKKGMALLFVTHDLLLARAAADRGMVMYRGCVVEKAPMSVLIDAPAHPYTRALAAAVPRLGRPVLTQETARGTQKSSGGCPYLGSCPEGDRICRQGPKLKEIAPGHQVACWMR
jgi:peptide/nickel transport system ATP-binding protein